MSDDIARQRIKDREILNEPWSFTDDTVMAIGIYRILEKYGKIDQDELAKVFADNYALDWHRGYGGAAHSILRSIKEGKSWREAASQAFDGMGSMGNGGAMRVAPIGAYFADDIDKVFFVNHFSLKKRLNSLFSYREFPCFQRVLLYASWRIKACSIR